MAESDVPVPPTSGRLTQDERARVGARFDADAVERLVALTTPDSRAALLESFYDPVVADSDGSVQILVKISDPAMQRALDDAWAPRWARMTLRELEGVSSDLPGVRDAIARLRKAQEPQ